MGAQSELLHKIAADFPEVSINSGAVTRGAMEATLAQVLVPPSEKMGSEAELIEICDRLTVSEQTKNRLAAFVHTKAQARSMDPSNSEFCISAELGELIMAAFVFETVAQLGADEVLVSRLFCTDAHAFDGNGFVPLTKGETRYICKKHSLNLTSSPIPSELLTEGGAALLAALGAKMIASPRSGTIKVGYGAGDAELGGVPNIVRAVYGEDDGSEVLFESEAAFGDVFAEFAWMEA